jgi:regulator of protease activity HflC (stomatin/prohibitin superfamily)
VTPPVSKDRAEPDGVWAQTARIAFRFLFGAVGFIALGWAVSNVRQVQPDSWAVVLRFGNVVRQQGAGLLIAWPRPIEQIVMLPSADRQTQLTITRFEGAGYGTTGGASGPADVSNGRTAGTVPAFHMEADPRLNTGFLLTGDSSVVHLQATLFFQISDPVAYVIAGDHVGPGLERLFIASAVSLCAARDLDTILVARPEMNQSANETLRVGREQLRADLMKAVNRRLDDLAAQGAGFGVTVSRVDLVPAIPSNAKTEFDRVLVATQEAEATIAEARTKAELIAQQAKQRSDSIITDATAGAREQVSDATSRTAAILALTDQSQPHNRQMLINRIYFARVGALMAKMGSVETVDADSGTHLILSGPQKR